MDTTPPPADRPRVPPGIGRCSFEAPAGVFCIIVKSGHELIHMRRRMSWQRHSGNDWNILSPCTLHDVLGPAAGSADPLSALMDVVRKIILSATSHTILIPKLGILILEGMGPPLLLSLSFLSFLGVPWYFTTFCEFRQHCLWLLQRFWASVSPSGERGVGGSMPSSICHP